MDYQRLYKNIMITAKLSNRQKGGGVYYESHHIIPDFMFYNRTRKGPKGHLPGNPNDPQNLVLLTAREHILAHVLLAKSLKGKRYWAPAASSLVWFYTKVMGEHPRQYREIQGTMKKYERYRELGRRGISEARRGTFPAKDVITGEPVGSVSNTHPHVLSGQWVHVTKGRKQSDHERSRRPPQAGKQNANSREINVEYIKQKMLDFDNIVKSSYDNKFIASIFCKWFDNQVHTIPYCTRTKSGTSVSQPIYGMSNKFLNIRKIATSLAPITGWTVPAFGSGKYAKTPASYI